MGSDVWQDGEGVKILLVDDETSSRLVLRRIFESQMLALKREIGAIVDLPSVEKAKACIENGFRPDVIFSDLEMGPMSGEAFHAWLKGNHPALLEHFFIVSGSVPGDFARELGDHFISKTDFGQIRAALRQALSPNKKGE